MNENSKKFPQLSPILEFKKILNPKAICKNREERKKYQKRWAD
jgi:hypothetical protein